MDRLPTPQRQVIELCFYSGLSQSEAATQTGFPLGTAKTGAYLAMKKLRRELAGEFRNLVS
jgi:RNA polymerase sigma-70 factor (ECF subfamily)